MRTSVSHPLQIAAVSAADGFGFVGLTLCPGKYDPYGTTGAWNRDLDLDLDRIMEWGASAVLTLVTPEELIEYRVETLGVEVRRRRMKWFHLPIVDGSIPDGQFEGKWRTVGKEIRSLLRNGSNVLIHCRGGLGRAGTISARLLVELGIEPRKAIICVRKVRPGAIENDQQESFVLRLRKIEEGAHAEGRKRNSAFTAHVLQVAKNWSEAESRGDDWFERLTGFVEASYKETRSRLKVQGGRLHSRVNHKFYGIGELELPSLEKLRHRAKSAGALKGAPKVSIVEGDVRELHSAPEYSGALFQVASQFNLLEMTGPIVTPEYGVTRYQSDPTQGPACAIAAGAATIYRNYFAPIDGHKGQTAERQIDTLSDIGVFLSEALRQPVHQFWQMQNGYALCTRDGLAAISRLLNSLGHQELDDLRGKLRIGIHWDVEVTDDPSNTERLVSQAFCSALPVAYVDSIPRSEWRRFARLILEAAYEATLWSAALNAQRGISNIVLLTLLGGGAFGNESEWIHLAIRRALLIAGFGLDVRIVSFGQPSQATTQLVKEFS